MSLILIASQLLLAVHGTTLDSAGAPGTGFDADPTNQPPAGWECTLTGTGSPRWLVVADAAAPSPPNVLEQSGTATFPLCLRQNPSLRDGFVAVRFCAVAGKEDQAAGLIWRVQNATNYYVCRANSLENNVVLYKVVDGKRKALDIVGRIGGYGVQETIPAGTWHELRVEFAGSRFRVALNRRPLFEVEDATFETAGRIGLWTKADSVTRFDDFRWGP